MASYLLIEYPTGRAAHKASTPEHVASLVASFGSEDATYRIIEGEGSIQDVVDGAL